MKTTVIISAGPAFADDAAGGPAWKLRDLTVTKTDTGYSLSSTKGAYYIAGHEAENDLTDVFVYDDELLKVDTMGVACAHKKFVDNGKEYTLLY